MAIVKDIKTETGAIATYHKIGRLTIDKIGNSILIDTYSYLSKTEREAGSKPLVISSQVMDLPSSFDSVLTVGYEMLKTLPDFENAIDD